MVAGGHLHHQGIITQVAFVLRLVFDVFLSVENLDAGDAVA